MTVLLHTHQHHTKLQNKTLIDSATITKARSDKNKKHNYPKTRKSRTINYDKKIMNDEFIFSLWVADQLVPML